MRTNRFSIEFRSNENDLRLFRRFDFNQRRNVVSIDLSKVNKTKKVIDSICLNLNFCFSLRNSFFCRESQRCLSLDQRCNEINDCHETEDRILCEQNRQRSNCSDIEFLCDGECLSIEHRCDQQEFCCKFLSQKKGQI